MATYTLHVPADGDPGDGDALEHAELVKDGFAWIPFVLGPFTFLWFWANRLWLAGAAVLVIVIGLAVVLRALRVDTGASFAAELLLAFLIGLEANSLRRWTLRKRKPLADVVSASSRDEAETKSFARWLERSTDGRPAVPSGPPSFMPYRKPEHVIGLFPETERPG